MTSEPHDGETETIPTVGSGGTDNSFLQLTLEKLDGKNFREWAQSVKLVIDGKGKLGYLTGDTKKPASTDVVRLQRWKSENSLVTAWLVNSMVPSIRRTYLFLPTAKDVWDAVRETYSDSENSSQFFEIKSKLWQLKQGDREVTEYYMEMVALWQELDLSTEEDWDCPGDCVRYRKKLENERVFEFLAGLHRNLDDVRGRVLGRRPLPSTREVFAEIRREESRRRVMLNGENHEGEVSALVGNRYGPKISGNGPRSVGHFPSSGPGNMGYLQNSGPVESNFHGLNYNIGPGNMGLLSKGPGTKQQQKGGRPWCEHCRKPGHKEDTCWDLHGKPTDWKPRQNNRNRGYQVSVDHQTKIPTPSSTFNSEQIEQLYKIFSSLQTPNQSSKHDSSSSLAHRSNFLTALNTTSTFKIPWIIDSGASDHMTGSYNLFSSYSTCAGNLKVKIADGSLSPVAGKGSIQLSDSIILKAVLHVPNLSCNLLSISQLTKTSNCTAKFLSSHCVFSGPTIGEDDWQC